MDSGGSLLAQPRRLLIRLSALLLVLGLILAGTTWIAVADPHGLANAPAILPGDLPLIEPLYGGVGTPTGRLEWSPDGRWIALGGGEPEDIFILNAGSGGILHTLAPTGTPAKGALLLSVGITDVRWSPDGSRLAAAVSLGFPGPGWVYIFDGSGQQLEAWEADYIYVGGLAWSPDGTRLATAAGGNYALWEAATGALLRRVTNVTAHESADWSPDGRLLAFGGPFGAMVFDAATGDRVFDTDTANQTVYDTANAVWSHDGSHLLVSRSSAETAVYNRTGAVLWRRDPCAPSFCRGGFQGRAPSWDPTDTMVAVPLPLGIAVLDAWTGDTLRILAFPVDNYGASSYRATYGPGTSQDVSAAWSPGGGAIASLGSMSNPSFRMWGIRRSPVAFMGIAFDSTLLAGLPMALGPGLAPLVVAFPAHPRRKERETAALTSGAALCQFVFAASLLGAVEAGLLGRVYGGDVVPSGAWWATSLAISAAVGALAVTVGIWAFRQLAWPPEREARIAFQRAARFYGEALVPVLWALTAGTLILAGLDASGLAVENELLSVILATAGGIGLILGSIALARVTGLRLLRAGTALTLSSALSLATVIGLGVLGLGVLLLSGINLGPEASHYGFTVFFGFGLTPFIVAVVFLMVVGSGAALLAYPPRFALFLFTRLSREEVIESGARRRILEYVQIHPGTHFRELLRTLNMGSGTLHYHLYVLEREGFLEGRREGMYRRFFPLPPPGVAPSSGQ